MLGPVAALALLATGAWAQPLALDEIREPTVVAVPPSCAVRDLCVMPDGEIRHYGAQMHRGVVKGVYIASRDNGLSWKTFPADGQVGALTKCPWADYWLSCKMSFRGRENVWVRSTVGPSDTNAQIVAETRRRNFPMRQLLPLAGRKRWLATFCDDSTGAYRAEVGYSDDDGKTWKYVKVRPVANVRRRNPGSARDHWYCDGTEPSIVELRDGTVLMAVRTSGPHAAFYRSSDGGATWTPGEPDARFWQANTMPLFLRLRDGRLLFFWNNTQLLPELDPKLTPGGTSGVGGFTNRDALHAAISDDDGRTWRGFREIALSEFRNASDWRELGNDEAQEKDKSVHQSQAVELPGGKVLLVYGQNVSTRRIAIFDPDWLLETSRSENFQHGFANVSHHLYLVSRGGGWMGWAGHCAWNRLPGVAMVLDRDNGSIREVMQLGRTGDKRLFSDLTGAVWNFPAATVGSVTVNARVLESGFRMTLCDHWINPCDPYNPAQQPVSLKITAAQLPGGKPFASGRGWGDVTIRWDCRSGRYVATAAGKTVAEGQLAWIPPAGFSYLHLQTLAEGPDFDGTHFRSMSACGVMTAAEDDKSRDAAFARDYVRSDYVQGDGKAWIDLGTRISGQDVVRLRTMHVDSVDGQVFGGRTNPMHDAMLWIDDICDFYSGGSSAGRCGFPVAKGVPEEVTISCARREYVRPGVTNVSTRVLCASFETPVTAALFKAKLEPGKKWSHPFTGRIYAFSISVPGATGEVKRLDLVPCRRRADGVVGFYDRVSGRFLSNAAPTGAFVLGGVTWLEQQKPPPHRGRRVEGRGVPRTADCGDPRDGPDEFQSSVGRDRRLPERVLERFGGRQMIDALRDGTRRRRVVRARGADVRETRKSRKTAILPP